MSSFLNPELLRRLEPFQLLATCRIEFVATSALTPALSPRRGRILRRLLNIRGPLVVRQVSSLNHQPAAIGNPTLKSPQRGRLLSSLSED